MRTALLDRYITIFRRTPPLEGWTVIVASPRAGAKGQGKASR